MVESGRKLQGIMVTDSWGRGRHLELPLQRQGLQKRLSGSVLVRWRSDLQHKLAKAYASTAPSICWAPCTGLHSISPMPLVLQAWGMEWFCHPQTYLAHSFRQLLQSLPSCWIIRTAQKLSRRIRQGRSFLSKLALFKSCASFPPDHGSVHAGNHFLTYSKVFTHISLQDNSLYCCAPHPRGTAWPIISRLAYARYLSSLPIALI